MRRIPMYMKDWIAKLDGFLSLNDREILTHAGKISHELAKNHAETEFEKFRAIQDQEFESDFDKIIKKIK